MLYEYREYESPDINKLVQIPILTEENVKKNVYDNIVILIIVIIIIYVICDYII